MGLLVDDPALTRCDHGLVLDPLRPEIAMYVWSSDVGCEEGMSGTSLGEIAEISILVRGARRGEVDFPPVAMAYPIGRSAVPDTDQHRTRWLGSGRVGCRGHRGDRRRLGDVHRRCAPRRRNPGTRQDDGQSRVSLKLQDSDLSHRRRVIGRTVAGLVGVGLLAALDGGCAGPAAFMQSVRDTSEALSRWTLECRLDADVSLIEIDVRDGRGRLLRHEGLDERAVACIERRMSSVPSSWTMGTGARLRGRGEGGEGNPDANLVRAVQTRRDALRACLPCESWGVLLETRHGALSADSWPTRASEAQRRCLEGELEGLDATRRSFGLLVDVGARQCADVANE
jgi:hypothetical protein